MSESAFMKAINDFKGWNNWLWVPWINDCHSDLENAFEQAGVDYPEAPNGRVDWDDIIMDKLDNFLDKMSRYLWYLTN